MKVIIAPKFFLIFFALYGFLLIGSQTTLAYQFDKTRFILSTQQPIDSIKLSNPLDNQPNILRLTVLAWTQKNGVDQLTPTKDLIIAPPQITLSKGQSRIVRIGWRSPKPNPTELTYRLIIEDLTPYVHPKNTIFFKLRVDMPIFITPFTPNEKVEWQVSSADNGNLKVKIVNSGNIHLQIKSITLTNAKNEIIAQGGKPSDILSGQTKETLVPLKKSPEKSMILTADTDRGKIVAPVNLM